MLEGLIAIRDKMRELEHYKSYGIIILKNGEKVEVGCLFRYIRDLWMISKRGQFDEDAQKLISSGTVVTNGIISVDILDISAMVDLYAENEIEEQKMKLQAGIEQKKGVNIDEAIFRLAKNSKVKDDENIENDD